MNGIAVIKIFLQPNANVNARDCAGSGHVANVAEELAAGHDAAAGGHLQRIDCAHYSTRLSGQGLSEQQLFDIGQNFVRPQLVTVAGNGHPVFLRRQTAPGAWWISIRRH